MGPNTSFLTVPLIIDKIKNLRDYQLSRNLPSFTRNFEEEKMPWKHVPHALIIKRSVCDEKSGGGSFALRLFCRFIECLGLLISTGGNR